MPVVSASYTSVFSSCKFSSIPFTAPFDDLSGWKPQELSEKSASNIGSIINLHTV